jgi:hypothetical protein
MPKFDLLLLPLLGGYIFLITFFLTRFYHQRIERQRLIFNSSILAVILSLIVLALDHFIVKEFFLNLRENIGEINPVEYEGLNESLLIFLSSYPLAKLFNLMLPKKKALAFVVNKWGNDFEKLFWTSLKSKDDEDKLLMITTKSNKVYVGYVNKISEPIDNSHITIIPNFSGFRNKETQEFKVTTDYLNVLEYYINREEVKLIDKKMGIVIPLSEIVMVSKFVSEIFDRFNITEEVEEKEKPEKPKRVRKPKPKI